MREIIQSVITQGSYETVSRNELHQAVERVGGIELARARAAEFARAAQEALENLPQSDFRDSLAAIPAYVLDRDH